jgi:hypothetical protein
MRSRFLAGIYLIESKNRYKFGWTSFFIVEMQVRIDLGDSAIPTQRSRRVNGGPAQVNPPVPKI